MRIYILNSLLAFSLLFVMACKRKGDPIPERIQPLSFEKYIAIGNSLTAGLADDGLYLEGQKVAYPNLIAEMMRNVGGGNFTSPFFSDSQSNGTGYTILTGFENGSPKISNVNGNAWRDAPKNTKLTKYTNEVQNLGIPGMRLNFAFENTYGAQNPFFERLLPDEKVGKTSYYQFIQGRNHTFFSLWLGNNDVFGYATSGAVIANVSNILTPKNTFASLYANVVNMLTIAGQKGVVATIPEITDMPYFNVVTVGNLLALAQTNNPSYKDIYIETSTGIVRKATDKDLICLPFQASGLFLSRQNNQGEYYGLASTNPIRNKWVLDVDEAMIVKDYIKNYNESIISVAVAKNLAIADAYSLFNQLKRGIKTNGVDINLAYISGGVFSLDGIHLTPRGNAVVANLFINAINSQYKSTLSLLDISKYRGVKLP